MSLKFISEFSHRTLYDSYVLCECTLQRTEMNKMKIIKKNLWYCAWDLSLQNQKLFYYSQMCVIRMKTS